MTWIDPAGFALLGPSSEWLWTAISSVAVLVSLLAIYREVRMQTAVKETTQVNEIGRSWASERLARDRLACYVGLQAGERVWDIRAAWRVAEFWETVASLARAGHVGQHQLIELLGPDVVRWWSVVEGFVVELREVRSAPEMNEHFEWLNDQVLTSGHDLSYWRRPLDADALAELIAAERDAIALEVSLRTTPAPGYV